MDLIRTGRLLPPLSDEYIRHLRKKQASERRFDENKINYRDLSKKGKTISFEVSFSPIRNDVIRAMSKTGILGNASIIND